MRSPATVGALFLVTASVLGIVIVTGLNPFANPYELSGVFRDTVGVKPGAAVRVAGIDVGNVSQVETLDNGTGRVTLELEDSALPIHEDATLKLRPRIFPEGNLYVELHAGSPSAPTVDDGATIPLGQTAAAVSLGDIVDLLEADTRSNLKVTLSELAKGFGDGGAAALNEYIARMEPAYRHGAQSSEAFLGEEPGRDLQRAIRGTQGTAAAFAADEPALRRAVSNLSATAAALGSQDRALEASVPALRDTLSTGTPALATLSGALPELRSFARDSLPGLAAADPALAATLPALAQARGLVGPDELQAAARTLGGELPALVGITSALVPLLEQVRAASRCTTRVLAPWIQSDMPHPFLPEYTGTLSQKTGRTLVGHGGEGRNFDANGTYSHISILPYAAAPLRVYPAPPPDPTKLPQHRPDVPCETQDPPNLDAVGGIAPASSNGGQGILPLGSGADFVTAPPAGAAVPLLKARELLTRHYERLGRRQKRLLEKGGWGR